MTFQRDFLLRAIEAIAAAIAAAVTRRRLGQLEEARAELDRLLLDGVGLDLSMLEVAAPELVAAQLGHAELIDAVAALLEEQGAIDAARGDAPAAERWRARAARYRELAAEQR